MARGWPRLPLAQETRSPPVAGALQPNQDNIMLEVTLKRTLLTISLAMLLIVSILSFGCSSSDLSSDIPSGKSCSENIAYLQSGVDKYLESFGKYPADVNQLLETKDSKGPFVNGGT